MSYEPLGGRAPLDYCPCRYPGSKLTFRGPRRALTGDYIVFLGGTETYGKFIREPFPAMIGRHMGETCVNMGWPNAGLDVLLNDPGMAYARAGARAVVLQVPGAQNMTNRFYGVHARRNDRFVRATDALMRLFPEMDFTEFHFTRHMLRRLQAVSPERFDLVREELRTVWVERMVELIGRDGPPVILLWFAARRPGRDCDGADVAQDPAFVTRPMLETVRGQAAHLIEVTASATALRTGTSGMVFSQIEAPAAGELLGPAAHVEAALALIPALRGVMARR
ncbi:hypothetical protein SAMN05444398_1091 [Roseovarius pacificus]|uniref:DUF6473 domain-containing protein n=1 Tax=Roseovarius pacificus TaxID=337701 RepID=A0A1M7FJ64_9RHOB|nr:DUF6473 family protein [Roseovarius pacificus]GGO59093.1 hypothetical protein GCM10011315_30270 [Roseovarius pacificus]SHM03729.1 hypothetical protein SAMN05444398_1091 [Roseovarius pacificus]